jgi:hypothetical protein
MSHRGPAGLSWLARSARQLGGGFVAGVWVAGMALAGSACLPNPQSVSERRDSFNRAPLRGAFILDAPPSDMVRVDAEFGRRAKLLGYTLDPPVPRSGERLRIRFFWTAVTPMAEDYQVFVHGDAIGSNAARIHGDHYPAEGKYPTDVWREGEIVVDPFSIPIPPGYGPRTLGVFVGLYHGNYRVPLTDRGLAEGDGENRSRPITINVP